MVTLERCNKGFLEAVEEDIEVGGWCVEPLKRPDSDKYFYSNLLRC